MSSQIEIKSKVTFYVLPNPDDYSDAPEKYALQLDNSYKLGYMTYKFGISYFIRLLFTGSVGGSLSLV